MRRWFISPRYPRGSMVGVLLLMHCGLACVLGVLLGSTAVLMSLQAGFSFGAAAVAGACIVGAVFTGVIWMKMPLTLDGALEFGCGVVLFYAFYVTDQFYYLPLCILMCMRPYSHGPEPGGWKPIFDAAKRNRRQK